MAVAVELRLLPLLVLGELGARRDGLRCHLGPPERISAGNKIETEEEPEGRIRHGGARGR